MKCESFRMRAAVAMAAAAVFFAGEALAGQSLERRRYEARRISGSPEIDGTLDDACWQQPLWASGFTQREPYEGADPSEDTAFQIVYDDRHLYVAIRAFDSEPDRIERRVSRRDDRQGDQVEIYLDSYFDHRTAFAFNVSSAGVKTDFVLTEDGAGEDSSWDAVWHAQVGIDAEGWTAELAIPFSQLRFADSEEKVWGVQVRRRLHRREELSEWQLIPKDASGTVHWFGELHGLDGIPPHRQIELLPYAVAQAESFESEAENPFATGRSRDLEGGLDGKLALTSDMTLTFTMNPDFGQVEADPSEVNLTTFETFFQEKRPFFIEGASIFNFQIMGGDGGLSRDNLFYSRRIGRRPQGRVEGGEAEHVSVPESTSMLGAFKLTGKSRNGWTLGVLESLTAREDALIDTGGARRREVVEPFTSYFVARVQKDFGQGQTLIGGMLTATNRDRAAAEANALHRAAYTGGIDLRHTWKDRAYYLGFKAVASQVSGDAATILETQRSPARYYQRPDADYVEVDPLLESLSGHGGTIDVGKGGGGHLRFSTGVTWRSPGLELNDVGFLRAADQILQWFWMGFRIWEPFGIFRSFNVNANQWKGWDFGGTSLFTGGNVNVNMQFRNYWGFGTGLNREGGFVSNYELRGGPALALPGGWGNWLNLSSDRRRKLRFNFGGWSFWGDADAQRSQNVWLGATYRPSEAMSISAEPFIGKTNRELQYVDTIELSTESRYVFGRLDQTTVGITLRLAYSVTPDLSIQFYGQPFISSGDYGRFKRITEPGAEVFADRFSVYAPPQITYDPGGNEYTVTEEKSGAYRFQNPDFDFRQLRSNLVVRWEYQPGSTLFVVWSQDRTGEDILGSFAFGEGLSELFRLHPHNVFLVKLSYRFAL